MPDAKIDPQEMTDHWSIGRVISSSSGFHTEHGSDELPSVLLDSCRLLYLRATQEQTIRMIITLTKQHLYHKKLEEL